MRSKPRTEIFFPAVQTAADTDYVPTPTRDEELARQLEGKPRGIRIAWQQKVGMAAAYRTFEDVVAGVDDSEDVHNLSDLLSITSLGTAYHTFAQPEAGRVMYRRVKMPRIVDTEADTRMSRQELIDKVAGRLAGAADMAQHIEELLVARETKELRKRNNILGLNLASVGMMLAVLNSNVPELHAIDDEIQYEVWQASQSAYTRTIELSGWIGARPTIAQLADDQSPLRRYLHDDWSSVSQTVHQKLVENLATASLRPVAE